MFFILETEKGKWIIECNGMKDAINTYFDKIDSTPDFLRIESADKLNSAPEPITNLMWEITGIK